MKLFRKDYPLATASQQIGVSARLLRENIWPVFYLTFLPGLISAIGLVLIKDLFVPNSGAVIDQRHYVGFGLLLAGVLYSLLAYPGAVKMQLAAVRGKHPEALRSFRAGLPYVVPVVLAGIASELAVVAGLIALIVPGLFLLRSYYLFQFYVVDRNLRPLEALRQCRQDSKSNAGYIWGTIGIVVLFTLLGTVLSGIPVAGYILPLAVSTIYTFGPALRYNEINNILKVKAPGIKAK